MKNTNNTKIYMNIEYLNNLLDTYIDGPIIYNFSRSENYQIVRLALLLMTHRNTQHLQQIKFGL